MALGITTENVAGGNLSWLGSRHGVVNARTGTLNAAQFTGPVVASGTPVTLSGDLYVPYDGTTLSGFVINDTSIAGGNEPVAILDHGRIRVDKLPVESFTVPASSAFVFVDVPATPGA